MNQQPATDTLHSMDFSIEYPREPGRVIRGRVVRPVNPERPLPVVIVVHGFKGFLRWGFFPELQRRIAASGFACIAINLSGSGVGPDLESFTEPDGFLKSTPTRDVEDLETLRRAMTAGELEALGGLDLERTAILGHSRGGGTALLHAERSGDYRCVVTWASVAASNRFPSEVEGEWRATGYLEIPNARTGQTHRLGVGYLDDAQENAAALDILAACGRSRTPTLLIHGTDDEAVPIDEGRLLQRAFSQAEAELMPVEGAGHTFGARHPSEGIPAELERVLASTLGFLRRHLS